MKLDELIKEMQKHGFILVPRFRIQAKGKYLFEWLNLMATTVPLEAGKWLNERKEVI